VRRSLEVKPTTLGATVADILGRVFRGIYHLDDANKIDWTNPRYIEVHVDGNLATFDGNALTELVVLAHEELVRVEVRAHSIVIRVDEEGWEVVNRNPEKESYDDPEGTERAPVLCLLFHQREGREGRVDQRHPTIEQAVEAVRHGA
jgi:hypothetical protein